MISDTTAYGLNFYYPTSDKIVGPSLRVYGEFAKVERDFILDHATRAGTFIDVGANLGAIALPFAAARPEWKVLAVEAQRRMASILSANAVRNGLWNVEVFNAAAGAAPGLADFPAPALSENLNFGDVGFGVLGGKMEAVRVLTLDEIAPADTRLVKIDVQGFEPDVLKGASRLIAGRSVIWLVEVTNENPEAKADVVGALQAAGYAVHWFFSPFATPDAEKRACAEHTHGDYCVVALPPGVENLWGLPLIGLPEDLRPSGLSHYPYLERYGYELVK